jgi:hypothetical protein
VGRAVLDRNVALVFSHPERDFPYFGEVRPLLGEGLLISFCVNGEAMGTIWVVSHDESRRFDAEDLRVITNRAFRRVQQPLIRIPLVCRGS